jgi:hypothetical protein
MTESMHGMLMHQRKFCAASVPTDMRMENNRESLTGRRLLSASKAIRAQELMTDLY